MVQKQKKAASFCSGVSLLLLTPAQKGMRPSVLVPLKLAVKLKFPDYTFWLNKFKST